MGNRTEFIIALGSNTNQQTNIDKARQLVSDVFGNLVFTENIWTSPIDIDSDKFLNCLACAQTTLHLREVRTVLKQIEKQMGACEEDKAAGKVVIDLDILLFRRRRYHIEDWERPYIKQLISELNKIKTQ